MSLSGEQIVTISVAGFASLTSIIVVLIQCRKERRLAFEKESVRVFGLVFEKLINSYAQYDSSESYHQQLNQDYMFFISQSPYLNYDLYTAGDAILSALSEELHSQHSQVSQNTADLIKEKLKEYEIFMQKHYFFASRMYLKRKIENKIY